MHEVKLPQLGQSVEEASIVQWFKQEGDAVKEGEPLYSVQTDKAEIEVEAPASGVLRKILVEPDVFVPVLTVVALVGEADKALPGLGEYGAAPEAAAAEQPEPVAEAAVAPAPAAAGPSAAEAPAGPVAVSPRAKSRAAELSVDAAAVSGTGPRGRVVEADVLAFAQGVKDVRISPTAKRLAQAQGVDVTTLEGSGARGKIMKADVAAAVATPAGPVPSGGVERVPLSPMRRVIAERMAQSKYAAPHYYITVEVDMAAAKEFRRKVAAVKPSINDLVLYATVKALREYPGVNARWAGDAIEVVADVNLGIAVALPEGLIVPVVKQAQTLSLEGLKAAGAALIERARLGKLLPDDYIGNTFTVSNLGPFGVDHFTAIINQPDSAILAVGQMKDRPVAIEGGIHVRPIMKMTLSSDHRVIDGSVAAQFMGRLKQILEEASL